MDGLLLDTEKVSMHVFKQACSTVNLPFYEDTYLSIIGRNSAGIDKILRRAYGNNLDKLHDEWRRNYDAIVKHQPIPIKQGVVELLAWLKENGIPTSVATSTQRDVAKIKLKLSGLDKFFNSLTCGCEVSKGKPDPEIYLLAAERLGVKSQHCLAFEDSNNGVRSAISAQMTTFQIPDLVEPCDEVRSFGHNVFPSLLHVMDYLKSNE